MGGGADPHGNVASGGPTRSAGSVSGTITLAPRLAVGPSDVLYVIARKGSSTLAVRRVDKPSFPFAFELSGADVMMGGVAFEGPLDIVARVSRTGDAIPAKGDVEGTARDVKVPSRGLRLTIDSVRP
jgi:cytochrome c-type biogenesis protein CcmH